MVQELLYQGSGANQLYSSGVSLVEQVGGAVVGTEAGHWVCLVLDLL